MPLVLQLTQAVRLTAFVSFWTANAVAFDPAGPPPKWVVGNTARFMTRTIVPSVTYEKNTVAEVFGFMDMGRPKEYAPVLAADETLLASKTTFSMAEHDVSVMDALAGIATRVDADLVISPGRAMLRARAAADKQTGWTVSDTVEFVTQVRYPKVNFEKTPLKEVLELLARQLSHEHTLTLVADEKLLGMRPTVSLDEGEMSALAVLAAVADECRADLVISPGKIMLQARESATSSQKREPAK